MPGRVPSHNGVMVDTLEVGEYEPVERAHERGRAERTSTRRQSLARLVPSDMDPVSVLVEQNVSRLPDLAPLRFARMLTDPFAFYRGAAAVMAGDLAVSPHTSLNVLSCGDAHVVNFGLYASPERSVVFDLNDFDEAAVAPWEWDVKRLVTSVVIGARHAGHNRKKARTLAMAAAGVYVEGLRMVMDLDVVARHYLHAEPELLVGRLRGELSDLIRTTVKRAKKRTSERVVRKLTEIGPDGAIRFREDPPILVHVEGGRREFVESSYRTYLGTVEPDVALLLSQFRVVDAARRVVGVGSVGTRCFLVLLEGPAGENLVLQIKEATDSVLVANGGIDQPEVFDRTVRDRGQGGRVIAGQRMLQAVSDPFLGSMRAGGHDFYVRQFHDMKGSVDAGALDLRSYTEYARSCGVLLARAHAQSPAAAAVIGYIGGGGRVVEAIADFALDYADKSREDFGALQAAAKSGRIDVEGPAPQE